MNMNEPPHGVAAYAARRSRLLQSMGAGVAVIPTAPERIRNRDSHYPYRFDSYFYYLTGFPEPEAVLVLVAGEKPRSILFCREKHEERETWDGFRYGPQVARERFGFDDAQPIGQLDETLATLLGDQPALFYAPGAEIEWDARVMRWLNAVRAQARTGISAPAQIHDIRVLLDQMRLLLDAAEIDTMRRAATTPAVRPAGEAPCGRRREYEIGPNCCDHATARSFRPGRSSSGANAACCITATTTPCLNGDLLLVDAGCNSMATPPISLSRSTAGNERNAPRTNWYSPRAAALQVRRQLVECAARRGGASARARHA